MLSDWRMISSMEGIDVLGTHVSAVILKFCHIGSQSNVSQLSFPTNENLVSCSFYSVASGISTDLYKVLGIYLVKCVIAEINLTFP